MASAVRMKRAPCLGRPLLTVVLLLAAAGPVTSLAPSMPAPDLAGGLRLLTAMLPAGGAGPLPSPQMLSTVGVRN